jgi:uncharacterized protein (DUF983 family)
MRDETPSLKTLLVRGWRKRCPRCGEGRLFRRFNILHKTCSVCGLQYLEDQGALFGYLFIIDRALFLFPLIVMIYFRLYVPGAGWFYASFIVLIFALFYTLPQRSGVGVALHYLRRQYTRSGPGATS